MARGPRPPRTSCLASATRASAPAKPSSSGHPNPEVPDDQGVAVLRSTRVTPPLCLAQLPEPNSAAGPPDDLGLLALVGRRKANWQVFLSNFCSQACPPPIPDYRRSYPPACG